MAPPPDSPTSPGPRRRLSHVSSGVDISQAAPRRRRTTLSDDAEAVPQQPPLLPRSPRSPSSQFEPPDSPLPERPRPRRSSTLSALSFTEINRDFQDQIVDPGPVANDMPRGSSSWSSRLPVVFVMLPPLVGLVFRRGSAFSTDILLLCLAGIFLHWSITLPWKWYHSAQEIRKSQEDEAEGVLASAASDADTAEGIDLGGTGNDQRLREVQDALTRLRRHEMVALATCFLGPIAAAYLVHEVRDLLSRPSESLVSQFNLAIFLLSAEIAPTSHCFQLLLARTLHLQRIVHSNPYRQVRVTPAQYRDLLARVDALEDLARQNAADGDGTCRCARSVRRLRAELSQEARAAARAEYESVSRAVRNYERILRGQTSLTDERLLALSRRVDDAVALAMAASRRASCYYGGVGAGVGTVLGWAWDCGVFMAVLPLRITVEVPRGAARGVASLWRWGRDGWRGISGGGAGRFRGVDYDEMEEMDGAADGGEEKEGGGNRDWGRETDGEGGGKRKGKGKRKGGRGHS